MRSTAVEEAEKILEVSTVPEAENPEQSRGLEAEIPEQSRDLEAETSEQSRDLKAETFEQSRGLEAETSEQSRGLAAETPQQSRGLEAETPESTWRSAGKCGPSTVLEAEWSGRTWWRGAGVRVGWRRTEVGGVSGSTLTHPVLL